MSGGSAAGRKAAAVLFGFAVALALPLGLPLPAGEGGEGLRQRLGELKQAMTAQARLHLPLKAPALPASSAFCGGCHTLPPHEGQGPGPAFLNHHSARFDCLVCHWAKASGPLPQLAWKAQGILQLAGTEVRDPAALRDGVTPAQKCFDRGQGCTSCHRQGALDRYARPGLTPQARASLERLPDYFTLSKDARWYFPQRPQPAGR